MERIGLNKTAAQIANAVHQSVAALGPGAVVSVGFMEGSMAGWNGPRPLHGKQETEKRANAPARQVPAAQAMFWNEFGTENIPPRPAFRTMITRQSPTWGRLAMSALKMTHNNAPKALQVMGMKIGEQLQESIIDFNDPPNAPSTIATKGGIDAPLLDSRNMLRSVEYQVSGGERSIVNGGA